MESDKDNDEVSIDSRQEHVDTLTERTDKKDETQNLKEDYPDITDKTNNVCGEFIYINERHKLCRDIKSEPRDSYEHFDSVDVEEEPLCSSSEHISGDRRRQKPDQVEPNEQILERDLYQNTIVPLIGDDPLPAINYLKHLGLLRSEIACESCRISMNWTKCSSRLDKYVWKCQVKECAKYKGYISIRSDSFFSQSKISLQIWIQVIYHWCSELNAKQAGEYLKISAKTMVDIYRFFREICIRYFEQNPIRLGGPGKTVHINELCFSRNSTHHRDRIPHSQIWVFGIAETSVSPSVGYMEIIESRDKETLLPIIFERIRSSSTIHSDEWEAYRDLQNYPNYCHVTVNHSFSFVNIDTSVHTQTIESYWARHKARIKSMRGCRRNLLHSYLQEFMWLERNKKNCFLEFCNVIKSQYPFN